MSRLREATTAEQHVTIAEVARRHPNEWVLLDQLTKGRDGFATGGVVVAHGTDKEVVLAEMDRLPVPQDVVFFYTGPIPEDAAILP